MNVDNVLFDVAPEFPGILLRPGFDFAAIRIEHRVGRIEHEFEARNFVEQIQREWPAHTTVIHAILMHGLNAGIEESVGHFADALKNLGWSPALLVGRFEAHDANVLCAEPLHPRDTPLHFGHGEVKRVLDFFRPVHDGGSEAIDLDSSFVELLSREVECFVGNVVEIGFGKARHFHTAHFDMPPTEFLGCGNLSVNCVSGFVADSNENHNFFSSGFGVAGFASGLISVFA